MGRLYAVWAPIYMGLPYIRVWGKSRAYTHMGYPLRIQAIPYTYGENTHMGRNIVKIGVIIRISELFGQVYVCV